MCHAYINKRRRSRSYSGSHSTRRDTNRRRHNEYGRHPRPLDSHLARRGEHEESRRRSYERRRTRRNTRNLDEERRPTRGFRTSSRIRRRTRGITRTTRRQGESEHDVSGECEGDKLRGGSPRECTWATGDATKAIATNAPHGGSGERHGEKHPTKGRKAPRGWRSGRGDSGEVHKYILSKMALITPVRCEGEQAEKTRRGIPPPGLSHPPWDNPTSFNLKAVTELG